MPNIYTLYYKSLKKKKGEEGKRFLKPVIF